MDYGLNGPSITEASSRGVKLSESKIKAKDILRFQDLMRTFVNYIIIIIILVKLMVCSSGRIKLSENANLFWKMQPIMAMSSIHVKV